MISARELNLLGIPNHKAIMPLAMKIICPALAAGADRQELIEKVRRLAEAPGGWLDDHLLGPLASALASTYPDGTTFTPRSEPAPWRQWGDINLEPSAVRQMEAACRLPLAVRGALMPDAHTGYGLPIGGVLAVNGAVVPYAVGVDIACRMRLTVLDLPVSALTERRDELIAALENETAFGVGACFTGRDRRNHPVMDENWAFCKVTAQNHDKAWKQLGSSGGGNHFAEFGELSLDAPTLGLEPGRYLALLSHSGSRGTGESVAKHYSKLAQELHPQLPPDLLHLAWLDLDGEAGQEYWAAMELMGRYASANHELIHQYVLRAVSGRSLAYVENHHNFAWREEYDGQEVIVHRKGATPAGEGVLGVVPGSMGAPGYVVQGKGEASSLNSCSHGAGRLMSRTAAFKIFCRADVQKYLDELGVHLISGGLDEAPMAYKDIGEVMAAQSDLVDILAAFMPRLVKMAPEERRGHRPGRKN